jgi:hypothetical protein
MPVRRLSTLHRESPIFSGFWNLSHQRREESMKLPRRNFLHLAAGAAALPALSRIAWAQTYPSRPVKIVVPVGPSGSSSEAQKSPPVRGRAWHCAARARTATRSARRAGRQHPTRGRHTGKHPGVPDPPGRVLTSGWPELAGRNCALPLRSEFICCNVVIRRNPTAPRS